MNEYRIFGPPGTGKTTYLTGQIGKAVEAHGPEGVAVASFTKAAAAELAGRDLPLGEGRVGTLHGYCFRALDRPKIAEANTDTWNEQYPHWAIGKSKTAAEDVAAVDFGASAEMGGEALLQQVGNLRARMVEQPRWGQAERGFYEAWCRWKRENNYRDFTDLIADTLALGGPMPGSPAVGFFDEVQDFTALELSLVRSWGRHMDTCLLAGDDDQCIYHFKGATPDAFLNPPIPQDFKRVLGKSWRLPRAIVDVSGAWISGLRNREPKPFEPAREGGSVQSVGDTLGIPGDAFGELTAAAMLGGESVMLLSTCTYMLQPVIAALRDAKMTWHNPFRRSNGQWNPFTPGKGLSTMTRLRAFLEFAYDFGNGLGCWELEDFSLWSNLLSPKKCMKNGGGVALNNMLGCEYNNHMARREAVMKFLREWMNPDAHGELQYAASTGRLDLLEKYVKTDKAKAVEYANGVVQTWGGSALEGTPNIIVGTIHSVKGGEADNVMLYPDISPKQVVGMFQDAEARDSLTRTFYVGMTRARNNLYLCSPSSQRHVSW